MKRIGLIMSIMALFAFGLQAQAINQWQVVAGLSADVNETFLESDVTPTIGIGIIDNLWVSATVSVEDLTQEGGPDISTIDWGLNARYYLLLDKIYGQVGFSQMRSDDTEDANSYDLQVGYSLFLGDHIFLDAGLKWDLTDAETFDIQKYGFVIGGNIKF